MKVELRAYGYIREAGQDLAGIVSGCGRSRATWSRLLRGVLHPEPSGIRDEMEDFWKRVTGRPVPRDFWHPAVSAVGATLPGQHARETGGLMSLAAQGLSNNAKRAWEIFANPFDPEALQDENGQPRQIFASHAHLHVTARIQQTIKTSGFLAVAGASGAGKSTLFAAAKEAVERSTVQLKVIRPRNIAIQKMNSVHISSEIIIQLANKRPPTAAHERDALAEQILTHHYQEHKRAVLVIDDAQKLADSTLKDLKHYWELRHGYGRLLGVILLGQTELEHRLDSNFDLREVMQRCELVTVPPMEGDVGRYLATRLGWFNRGLLDVFTEAAVEQMERSLHKQQYPLVINNAATAAMNIAASRSEPRVTPDDVEDVWRKTREELQELCL